MTKIKIIKREDAGLTKSPPTNKKASRRPKKPRSVESTIKDWITERRENDDAENRSRNSQLATWKTDNRVPAKAA
jgi:hypothetical protein